MQIEKSHKKKIEKIMEQMKCSKDFKCIDSRFTNLCKAKDIGMESYLECLEANTKNCEFTLPFGYRQFCKCPLRVYLAKECSLVE